ncbi:MAG: hypothetical protein KatS3mg078_1988 [Deltaproteobacteria bacterium]|nr:MAG: hypothetical protein KatS3mg078_1988 [Deltaproteobacteria bacterium]
MEYQGYLQQESKQRKTVHILVFFSTFFFYFYIGMLAQEKGFWGAEEVYLGEKALLAVRGEPARFENIGLTYPPFPFMLRFLPASLGLHPYAGVFFSSISGALTILVLISSLKRSRISTLITIPVIVNPLFIYAFSSGGSTGLFLLLLSLFTFYFKRFIESKEEDSFAFFISSLILGFSFLIRYEAVFFLIPLIFTLIKDKNKWRVVSKVLIFTFPSLFLSTGWTYINWLYKGDPFHFIAHTFGLISFETTLKEQKSLFYSLALAIILFPSYLVSLCHVARQPSLLILFLSPLAVALTSTLLLDNMVSTSYFCLLGSVSLIFESNLRGNASRHLLFLTLIVGALIGYTLPDRTTWGEEKVFIKTLIGTQKEERFKEEKELANYLKSLQGKIFFDDTHDYAVVFFHGDPKSFVLPYQLEFGFYLKAPFFIARYVVVPHPRYKNMINENNPLIFPEQDPNWELVERIGKWKIFSARYHKN